MKSVWIMVEGAVREDSRTPELDAARLHAASEWAAAGAAGWTVWSDVGPTESCLLALWGLSHRERRRRHRALLEWYGAGRGDDEGGAIYCGSFVMEEDGHIKDGPLAMGESETAALAREFTEKWPDDGARFESVGGGRLLIRRPAVRRHAPAGVHPVRAMRDPVDDLLAGRRNARLRDIRDISRGLLLDHPINHVRIDLGENPAVSLWPWGGGSCLPLERRDSVLPEPVRVLTDSAMARGAAALFGWPVESLPPVDDAGGMDAVPLARWVDALRAARTLIVYVSAPGRGGWFGPGRQTAASLEAVDREIIKPLKECLEALRPYRMVCTPLPGPACGDVHELAAPTIAAGEGIHADDATRWDAESCGAGRLGFVSVERIATYLEEN